MALVALVPKLADLEASGARQAAMRWIAGGVAAVLVALAAAARVLTASHSDWGEAVAELARDAKRPLRKRRRRSLRSELDREGVLRLYGYTSAAGFLGSPG